MSSPTKTPPSPGAKASPVGKKHRHRRHHRGQPMSLRTQVMRHVAGFGVLFVFFVFSAMRQSGKGGTVSDWSVIFYVIAALIAYGIGYFLYPIVHGAWVDSKK